MRALALPRAWQTDRACNASPDAKLCALAIIHLLQKLSAQFASTAQPCPDTPRSNSNSNQFLKKSGWSRAFPFPVLFWHKICLICLILISKLNIPRQGSDRKLTKTQDSYKMYWTLQMSKTLKITKSITEYLISACVFQCECWKSSTVCATESLCVSLEEKYNERVKTGSTVETFSLVIHHLALLCSHVHDPDWLWQSRSGSTSTCHVELDSLISDQETRCRHAEVSRRGCVSVCVTMRAGLGQS